MSVDEYIKKVIALGDLGSNLLASITSGTLRNNGFVEVKNNHILLRVPDYQNVVVCCASGDPAIYDPAQHAASLVDRLVDQMDTVGATPVGFANVIDSSTGEISLLSRIANALVERSDHYGIVILNGENAILGERITKEANVSGTMIGTIRDITDVSLPHFKPDGRFVYINSDGVGTKTEFYERSGEYEKALYDFAAMNLDDTAKIFAEAKVLTGVVETRGAIPMERIKEESIALAKKYGIEVLLDFAESDDRLMGYKSDAPSYNISGSVVSLVDEEDLKEPRKPQTGQYLIALRGTPNPRSNGITAKRQAMINLFGNEWHNTPDGKYYLDFLAEPSTVLYPVFREIMEFDNGAMVYHMSGGAYDGKLARPLAKHKLFVEINDLFPPDFREIHLAEASGTSIDAAYAKWPMGNDGFVATNLPTETQKIIAGYGLESRIVGVVSEELSKTGVQLEAYDGSMVTFSGK